MTKPATVRAAQAVDRGTLAMIRAVRAFQQAGLDDERITALLADLLPFLARQDAMRAEAADVGVILGGATKDRP